MLDCGVLGGGSDWVSHPMGFPSCCVLFSLQSSSGTGTEQCLGLAPGLVYFIEFGAAAHGPSEILDNSR